MNRIAHVSHNWVTNLTCTCTRRLLGLHRCVWKTVLLLFSANLTPALVLLQHATVHSVVQPDVQFAEWPSERSLFRTYDLWPHRQKFRHQHARARRRTELEHIHTRISCALQSVRTYLTFGLFNISVQWKGEAGRKFYHQRVSLLRLGYADNKHFI